MEFLNNLFDFVKLKLAFVWSVISVLFMQYIEFHDPVKKLIFMLGMAIVLDVITGIIKNRFVKKQPLSSKDLIGWDEKTRIPKKLVVIACWFAGLELALMSNTFLIEFGITGHYLAKGYISFYFFYEFISVLENASEIGLPGIKQITKLLKGKMPEEIKNLVERAKQEKEENK